MNRTDEKTIAALQDVLGSLARIRERLETPQEQAGCACRGAVLCSLHGSVYNRLIIASDEIARAIGDASRE